MQEEKMQKASSSWRQMHAGATAKRREWFHYYLSHHSVPCWPLSVFVSFWNPVLASTPKRLWQEFGTWANDSWRHEGQRFLLPTRLVFGRALHQELKIDLDGRGQKKKNLKCQYFICDSDRWTFNPTLSSSACFLQSSTASMCILCLFCSRGRERRWRAERRRRHDVLWRHQPAVVAIVLPWGHKGHLCQVCSHTVSQVLAPPTGTHSKNWWNAWGNVRFGRWL